MPFCMYTNLIARSWILVHRGANFVHNLVMCIGTLKFNKLPMWIRLCSDEQQQFSDCTCSKDLVLLLRDFWSWCLSSEFGTFTLQRYSLLILANRVFTSISVFSFRLLWSHFFPAYNDFRRVVAGTQCCDHREDRVKPCSVEQNQSVDSWMRVPDTINVI